MTDSINSALLAATTKSVKVLQNIQNKQQALIDDVNTIAREQKAQGEMLRRIHDKPEPEILSDIQTIVTGLSKSFATFDLDGLERSINASTRQTAEQSELTLITRIDHVKDTLIDQSNQTTNNVIESIHTTDKSLSDKVDGLRTTASDMHDAEMEELRDIKHSGQIETLRKLITGLKAQRNNLDKLANYIEILSDNVQKNRKDVTTSVASLVDTIQDSSARTKSMDIRLAAITGDDTEDSDDLAQSLALLEGLVKPASRPEPVGKVPTMNHSELDELNEIMSTLNEE